MTGVLLVRDDGVVVVEQAAPVTAGLVAAIEQLLGKLDLPRRETTRDNDASRDVET